MKVENTLKQYTYDEKTFSERMVLGIFLGTHNEAKLYTQPHLYIPTIFPYYAYLLQKFECLGEKID